MNENLNDLLSDEELDTIGEVMNISMGSAATALSTMLDKQVSITTPNIQQDAFSQIDNSVLEPAIIVKIEYVEGIDGTNVTMLRSNDMQVILDLLMGNEEPTPPEEFEFDDMSMSAACEVMNQMMGASATALSEILGMCVNISTPTATLVEKKTDIDESLTDFGHGDNVIAIVFQLEIEDVLNTTFACFLSISLSHKIVSIVNADMSEKEELPPPTPAVAEPAPIDYSQVDITQSQYTPPQQDMSQMQGQPPMGQPPMGQPPMGQPPQMQQQMQPQMQQPMQGQPPMGQPPMGQDMYGMQYNPYQMQPQFNPYVNPYAGQPQMLRPDMAGIKNAEFPVYSQGMPSSGAFGTNLNLLMGVVLDISVVVGRSKQKIKDIVDFGEGTLIELDKQTGAPAEIVVNGQLLAYGDVIVVGDNFGVRVTEIVGTKELLDSLNPEK